MPRLIPEHVLEDIQDRLDIVEIISGYIPLKKAGRNFRALCPFHGEKTPSFMVNPIKKIYHCFGCGAGGDVFGFVMKYEKVEFPEAVKILADKAGVLLPEKPIVSEETSSLITSIYKANELAAHYFHGVLTKTDRGETGRKYFEQRQLSEELVKEFRLGFACSKWDGFLSYAKQKDFSLDSLEKAGLVLRKSQSEYYDRFRNRVVFPIFDLKSKVVAFGARTCDSSLPKYINSPETQIYTKGKHLYGLNFSKTEIMDLDQAVIVEGYLDFLTPYQSGVKNVVASLGTALTTDQVRLLKRYSSKVVMVYDGDSAGEAATLRGLDILIQEDVGVRIVNLEKGHDPDSFIKGNSVEKFKGLIDKADTLFDYKLGLLLRKYDPDSVEEKVAIANEMLPTIAKVNNSILKSEYIKRLSEKLNCKEEALLLEMGKVKTQAYAFEREIEKYSPKKIKRIAEKILAGIMLDDKHTAKTVMERLTPEEFREPQIRTVIEEIYEMTKSGKIASSNKIILKMTDESTQQMIAELAIAANVVIDKDKSIDDCIKSIKKENLKEEIDILQTKLKISHGSSDDGKTNELLEQYNKLIKEYKIWS